MKICLYSPYFPNSVGGGEKYMLDVALALADKHQVFLAISSFNKKSESEIKTIYENFIDQSLDKIKIIKTPLGTNASFFKKLLWTNKFDLIYYQTDGSLFFSLAKKNILHIQIPLKLNKNNIIEKIKLLNWKVKNTNSEFTKKIIETSWQTKIDFVHQPKIDFKNLNSDVDLNKKEKIILHVGRFFKQLHSKKQEELIQIFKELKTRYKSKTVGYKLVLIGSVEDEKYAQEIAALIKDYPIEIHHQVTRKELNNWYKKSQIYWHATGYEVDQEKYPEKMEHFGISTVEAMASGCVPIVINKGGQQEILNNELKSLLWENKQQCINKTLEIIQDNSLRIKMANLAIERAKDFDGQRFDQILDVMINK